MSSSNDIPFDFFVAQAKAYQKNIEQNPEFSPPETEARRFARNYQHYTEQEASSFHDELLQLNPPTLYNFYFNALLQYQAVRDDTRAPFLAFDFDKIKIKPISYFVNLLENRAERIPKRLLTHYLTHYFKERVNNLSEKEKEALFYNKVLKGSIHSWFSTAWIMNSSHWSEEDKVNAYIEAYQTQKLSSLNTTETLTNVYRLTASKICRQQLENTVLEAFNIPVVFEALKTPPAFPQTLNCPDGFYECPEIYPLIEKKEPLFFERLQDYTVYLPHFINQDPDAGHQEVEYLKMSGLQYLFLNYVKYAQHNSSEAVVLDFFRHFASELNCEITSTIRLFEKKCSFFEVFSKLNLSHIFHSIDISKLNEDNQKVCVSMAVFELLEIENRSANIDKKELLRKQSFLENFILCAPTSIVQTVCQSPVLYQSSDNNSIKQRLDIIVEKNKLVPQINMSLGSLSETKRFKV